MRTATIAQLDVQRGRHIRCHLAEGVLWRANVDRLPIAVQHQHTEGEATGVVGKGIEGVFDVVGGILGGTGKAVEKGTGAVTGTKVVEEDVLKARLAAFDWPRIFTNAPNALPAAK